MILYRLPPKQLQLTISNQRTDSYGGSFENRIRICLEVIKAVRAVLPDSMPLFYRVNSTEWMEDSAIAKEKGSWGVDETIRFSKLLPAFGVDLLDVSSGANNEKQGRIMGTDDQVQIAGRIRKEIKSAGIKPTLLIGAVGMITQAERARDIVQGSNKSDWSERFIEFSEGDEAKEARDMLDGDQAIADVVLVARQFMREPEWVLRVAWHLGVEVQWPIQFRAHEIGRGMG